MPVDVPEVLPLQRVPFADFPSFSKLYTTYVTEYETVASYYAGDWRSASARREAADRTAAFARDRDVLVEVLLDQNSHWGLDARTHAHIEALRDPASVAVVTGQQVGLLTGPLYTPYKTITTLQLAQRLARETERPVVPIFWLEGTDHDLEEVAGVGLMHHNDLVRVQYTGHRLPTEGNLGPVGRLVLTDQIKEVLDQVGETLLPTEFKGALMQTLRDAYRPGVTLLDAFSRLMRTLFPSSGLVFINPDDARLKRLARPLFRREIEDYATAATRLQSVSETLEQTFHAQIHTQPTNLFLLTDEGRYPLDAEGDRFVLRGRGRTYSREALLTLLDREPQRFSPNVVLRPLLQDLLLPTAAYVGGPGEIAYFAQFKPIYDWAEQPMPVIYPRASASLLEGKVLKVLDKYDLSVADCSEDLDRLFQRVVVQEMEVDIEAVFKETGRHLHEAINGLKPHVERVDRTLGKAAEATRATFMKEWNAFKGRVLRAEKQNQEVVRSQLAKAQDNLMPNGTLQERTLSVYYFLNKYGPDLLERLHHDLSLDTEDHQVLIV